MPPASAVPPALPPAAAGKRTADEEEAAEDEDRSPHKYQKVGEDTVDEVTAAFEAEAAGDDNEWEDLVATVFCDITGETIDDKEAKEWQQNELEKVIAMNTFIKTTAAEAKEKGYKIIGTRFAMNKAKGKARLVAQDVRRGPVSPEHWAPTPSTVSLRVCLLLGAAAGRGTTVIDISSAFLYADLPEKDRVAVTPPPGHGAKGEAWLLQRSLYGLRVAPALWAEHLGRKMAANGFKRSRLDPGVFSKGRGKDLITATVHVDDMVIVGGRAARQELLKHPKAHASERAGE